MRTCPECAEQVQDAARVCRFCGYRFDPAKDSLPDPLRELANNASEFRGVEDADQGHWIWQHVPITRLSKREENNGEVIFAWDSGRLEKRAVRYTIYKVYELGQPTGF